MTTTTVAPSVEEINTVIRAIVNNDEDALQDAWVIILERGLTGIDEIKAVAKEVRRKAVNEWVSYKYKSRSLEAPIKESDDKFSLLDVIPISKPSPLAVEMDITSKSLGRGTPKVKGIARLDPETVVELRQRYPRQPLSKAIRLLLGLSLLGKQNQWQEWEDEIIKRRYSWGGSRAVATDVNRNLDSIRARAITLGIRRGKFRPSDAWLTRGEVAKLLYTNPHRIGQLVKEGELKAIKVYDTGKDPHLFFTEDAVIRFIKYYPFKYSHELLSGSLREYIPKWLFEWVPLKVACELVNRKYDTIYDYARLGYIEKRRGEKNTPYIRLSELQHYLANPRPRIPPARINHPYRVVKYTGVRHYAFEEDGDKVYLWCHKNWAINAGAVSKAIGKPTCKICLRALVANKAGKKISDDRNGKWSCNRLGDTIFDRSGKLNMPSEEDIAVLGRADKLLKKRAKAGRCKLCGSSRIVKNGIYFGGTQRYKCKDCGKVIENPLALFKMRIPLEQVLYALKLRCNGFSETVIMYKVAEKYGNYISSQTVHCWLIDKAIVDKAKQLFSGE